jgi:hypothetical protein
MVKFRKPGFDYSRVTTAEWILGYDREAPSDWRFKNWQGSKRRLDSPISMYIGELERFTLDRQVSFDLKETQEDNPHQFLIDFASRENKLQDLMYMALERGILTGAVYLFARPDPKRYYRIYLFDESEVAPHPDLQGYMVQVETPDGFERWGFTDSEYIEYMSSDKPGTAWVELNRTPHPYNRIPGVCIKNAIRDHSESPVASIDWLAIELASEIMGQTLNASANYTYFGAPWFSSSNPELTYEELLSRKQVLSGSQDAGLQETGILSAPAMPNTHADFLDRLVRNFCTHLRISWVPDTPPGDTSSLTLRLLYSKSINTAQSVGETYLNNGFLELMNLILGMSIIDKVTPSLADWELEVNYRHEVFPLTVAEKAQILGVVEQMISLGVRTEVALGEFYPGLTEDQIRDKLLGA